MFQLFDSLGIPLDMLLSTLDGHRFVVDWPVFLEDALDHGWREKTLRSRLTEAISDVYGPVFYKGWKIKFEGWMKNRGSKATGQA